MGGGGGGGRERNGLTIFAILYTLGNILSLARLVMAVCVSVGKREGGWGRKRGARVGGGGGGGRERERMSGLMMFAILYTLGKILSLARLVLMCVCAHVCVCVCVCVCACVSG